MKQISLLDFTKWLEDLDKEIQFLKGIRLYDLPDLTFRNIHSMFVDGLSIGVAARDLIK
jgi:hypothetical protein